MVGVVPSMLGVVPSMVGLGGAATSDPPPTHSWAQAPNSAPVHSHRTGLGTRPLGRTSSLPLGRLEPRQTSDEDACVPRGLGT